MGLTKAKLDTLNFYDKWALGKDVPERVRVLHFKNNHRFRKELIVTKDNGMFLENEKTKKLIKGWPYSPLLELPMEGIRGEVSIVTDRSYITDLFELMQEADLPFATDIQEQLYQHKAKGNGHNMPVLRTGQSQAIEQEHKAVGQRVQGTSDRILMGLMLIAGTWFIANLIAFGWSYYQSHGVGAH